jgi:hypothetical protein
MRWQRNNDEQLGSHLGWLTFNPYWWQSAQFLALISFEQPGYHSVKPE